MDGKVGIPHVSIRNRSGEIEIVRDNFVPCSGASLRDVSAHELALEPLRAILSGREQESFVILMLDSVGRLSGWCEVARGHADRVEVPTKEMFRTALMAGARSLILAHNHPSGDPTPSDADRHLTERVCAAGDMIDVPVFDHIIIGEGERFHSFVEEARTQSRNDARGVARYIAALLGIPAPPSADNPAEWSAALGERLPPDVD